MWCREWRSDICHEINSMLFGSTKIVIFIDRTRVVVGDCREDPVQLLEIKYTDDLPEVFDKIITKLPSNSYKIILSNKISYTVRWDKVGETQDRTIVKEELIKHIPEDFENDQFDWKIDKENKIEAIVMTKAIYLQTRKIMAKNPKIRLETQSISSLMWELGKNEDEEVTLDIFKYAANKGKEKGGDDMVLNVEVVGEEPVAPIIPTEVEESTVPSVKTKWPLIGGFVFLVILLGALGWYFMAKGSKQVATVPTPTSTPIPTATPAPVLQKVPSEFKLLIQNGTSTAGLAGTYKTKIATLGFTQIETGNADSPTTTTKMIVKEALPDSVQKSILEALNPLIPDITISEVDTSTSSSDIVIILGTK